MAYIIILKTVSMFIMVYAERRTGSRQWELWVTVLQGGKNQALAPLVRHTSRH